MKKCKGCSHPTICNTHGCAAEEAKLNKRKKYQDKSLSALTDAEIEAGRKQVFSTDNPFCPCDRKTMLKAVRWAERVLAKRWGVEVSG